MVRGGWHRKARKEWLRAYETRLLWRKWVPWRHSSVPFSRSDTFHRDVSEINGFAVPSPLSIRSVYLWVLFLFGLLLSIPLQRGVRYYYDNEPGNTPRCANIHIRAHNILYIYIYITWLSPLITRLVHLRLIKNSFIRTCRCRPPLLYFFKRITSMKLSKHTIFKLMVK